MRRKLTGEGCEVDRRVVADVLLFEICPVVLVNGLSPDEEDRPVDDVSVGNAHFNGVFGVRNVSNGEGNGLVDENDVTSVFEGDLEREVTGRRLVLQFGIPPLHDEVCVIVDILDA